MANSRRVAVVGATGVLGRALVPLLLEHGYAVRAIVRSAAKAREVLPPGIEIVTGDLLDAQTGQKLPEWLAGCAAVLHIATAIPRDMSAPHAWDANNRLRTDGVRNLLQAALHAGAQQYLQQSIIMAYPDRGDEWITEDTPLDTSPERAGVNASVIAMEDFVRTLSADRLRLVHSARRQVRRTGHVCGKYGGRSPPGHTRHLWNRPELSIVDPCGRYGECHVSRVGTCSRSLDF